MDHTITKERRTSQSAVVIYSGAGVRRSLPAAVVWDIAWALPSATVPFAPVAFEGLVEADGVLTAQFDLSLVMGAAPRTGRYAMLVRTTAGLVRVRVDGASFMATDVGAAPLAADAVPSGLAAIEALIVGFAPPTAAPEPPSAPVDGSNVHRLDVLIVKSGAAVVAFPATEIERIERHRGSVRVRKGDACERIVRLEDDVLPGLSLAAQLGCVVDGGVADEKEGWALVVRIDSRRVALTVAEVQGLVSAPLDRFRRLRHRNGVSVRLLDSDRGMIEVIEPTEFGAARLESASTRAPSFMDRIPDEAPPAASEEAESWFAACGRLTVGFEAFSCVFPEAMVVEVLGRLGSGRVSARRSRGALPLFDFACGAASRADPGEAASSGILVLGRPGRRALALLVPRIAPATVLPAWRPPPLVPLALRGLFEAVRINGSICEFLMRATAFDRPHDPLITDLLKTALVGWLDVS